MNVRGSLISSKSARIGTFIAVSVDFAFACSVCTMLPLSVVSLVVYWLRGGEFLTAALPYLAGGALGGIAAGLLLRRLSAVWLHRALGALIVWGGLRLLLR